MFFDFAGAKVVKICGIIGFLLIFERLKNEFIPIKNPRKHIQHPQGLFGDWDFGLGNS